MINSDNSQLVISEFAEEILSCDRLADAIRLDERIREDEKERAKLCLSDLITDNDLASERGYDGDL